MNYSEEEKEAIERIQKRIKDNEDYSTNQVWLTEDVRCAGVVLNLIQKQDKIIDMAMELIARKVGSRIEICPDMNCCKETEGNRTCKQCAIEYFKKEVEKDVKD